MSVIFTPAQQQAIDARNRELLISAAAGSGKTAVLVERILRMIREDNLSIDRMLIVTFTRAAAGEMRDRLERKLSEAAQGDARLLRQADLVASAQISTIHSFCQKTVREHFQHCQIDPQFGLCDERTRAAFYQESMEETLNTIYERAHQDGDIASLVAKYAEHEVTAMLDALYRFLMSRPDPMEWLRRNAEKEWKLETLDDEPMAVAFCGEAGLIIDGMLSLWHEAQEDAHDPAFPEKYLTTLRLDGELLSELSQSAQEGLTHLLSALGSLSFSRLPPVKPQTGDEARLAERFKELRSRWKKMVDELKKLLPEDAALAVLDMAAMGPAAKGLAKAMILFHETFSQKKRDQAVIDFNDLEHMTLSILQDERLRNELKNKFDAIFVDEYQDVSELQEAILNGLKRPLDDPRMQYAFYVGDVKQSIYRFRLAEPGLFLKKLNSFSADENAVQRKIILNRNFRSRCAVLDAVNRVFEHVMDSRVTEIDYDSDAKLYPGSPSQNDPQTELHILNSFERKPQDMVLAEAEWIADDILATVGQPVTDRDGNECGLLKFSDVAILLPVSKNIADKVELVLSRRGIPVYCDASADVMGAEEVQQVIQYLTVLDNLMNDVALIAVLRSPAFEMTEQELAQVRLGKPEREASFLMALMEAAQNAPEPLRSRCADVLHTLETERFYLSSMSMGDYLWDFLSRSGLYAHYGAQPGGRLRQANLRMLCTRAAEYEKNHTDGLHGFVESLLLDGPGPENSPTVLNPWENVVRVMTIHKSKGLEFPTVYVMNLGRNMFGRGSTRAISVHGEVGFSLGYVNEQARTKRSTLLQGAIALREKNAERAERARVLYVALTRPKQRLVMVGSASAASVNMDALLCASPSDVYAVRGASSMLDWILQSVSPLDDVMEFSTNGLRKNTTLNDLSSEATNYPQKKTHWKVVFHSDPAFFRQKISKKDSLSSPIALSVEKSDVFSHIFEGRKTAVEEARPPLKVGVTALCRAMEAGEAVSPDEETAENKRFPLLTAQPRISLMASTPAMPAFLEPPKEERALMRGVETHRVLGLLDLERFRDETLSDKAIYARVCESIEALVSRGVMTPQQSDYADRGMIARFLQSDLGRRVLRSPRVMREWAFNLRVTQPFSTIVQGVIDLCFLEDGAWVLVDFKTDHVEKAADLWPRYRRQMAFYREALCVSTPFAVKEALLYSLRLSQAAADGE